jgi:hypothetical protein
MHCQSTPSTDGIHHVPWLDDVHTDLATDLRTGSFQDQIDSILATNLESCCFPDQARNSLRVVWTSFVLLRRRLCGKICQYPRNKDRDARLTGTKV